MVVNDPTNGEAALSSSVSSSRPSVKLVDSFGGSIRNIICQLERGDDPLVNSSSRESNSNKNNNSNSNDSNNTKKNQMASKSSTMIHESEEEKDESFSARTSFTADSPYYTSYVEGEMRQVQVLSETLRDISARAKTFGKCGALMAEATRRLALACRLKPSTPASNNEEEEKSSTENKSPLDRIIQERQEAVGEEMMAVLSTLGEVRV